MTRPDFAVTATRGGPRRSALLTPRLVGLLLLGSVLALLPPGFTGCARVIVQPVEWLRLFASSGARNTRQAALSAMEAAPTPDQYGQIVSQKAALERLVAHQSIRLDELERRVDDLSGLRGQLASPNSKIVVASVVAPRDASPQRESIMIDRGTANTADGTEIRVDQWVAAGASFSESRSTGESGLTLIAKHTLIGVVAEVHSLTSRVQLVTDPGFGPKKVRLARRLADGTLALDPRECLLEGQGRGKMAIRQFPENYFNPAMETLVLAPADASLPGTLALGRVTASRAHPEAPLVFDLEVTPIEPAGDLSHVYVIVP